VKRIKFFALLALSLTALANPSLAFAAKASHAAAQTTPADKSASSVVKNFYVQLVDVMKHGDQLGFSGRYKKLEPAIKTAFNLPMMAHFAVGPAWTEASANEQSALISAFSDFSVATYASRFANYDGEQFDVVDEKPTTGGVIVETKLTPKDGDAVSLNYLMHTDETGGWRIVDVYLNGTISELATRRSEFTAIVSRDGLTALVNSLDAKSKQMGPS